MFVTHPEQVNPGCYRVLVVDDCADTIELLTALFALLGHAAHGTSSGRDALRIADELEPDLILLDIQLPDLSGYEVARALRSNARLSSCYIAALTAWARPTDMARALSHGFDQHVPKPSSVTTLQEVIAAVTEHKRALERHALVAGVAT